MSSRTINNYPGFVIENTTIAVDLWPKDQPQLTHYFLTHAHTDHTKNLDSTWTDSLIYCSKITKKLIMDLKGVDEKIVMELDMNRTHIMRLDESTTFNVTLIDANHCPGAVMFLFEGYFGSILATGDFRYSPSMFTDGPLADKTRELEICYLDNTYLHECFEKIPSRAAALKEIIDYIELSRSKNDKIIFYIKMKLLGKEELVTELYNHFHVPMVVASPRYNRYTNVLGLDSDMFLTEPASDSFIFLEDNDLYFNQKVVDFSTERTIYTVEPTAMHLKQKRNMNDNYVKIPYTDHSSFKEIGEFVQNLRPKKIIPIVRKPLPNNVSTDDIKCLNKYRSKRAPMNSASINAKYKLLLKAARASVQRATHNLLSQMNKSARHTDTPNSCKTVSRITHGLLGQELTSTPNNKQRIMNQHVNDLTPIHLNSNITKGRVTKTRGRATRKKTQIDYEDCEEIDLDILLKDAKKTTKATSSPGVKDMRVVKLPFISAKKIPAIYKLQNIKTNMDPISEEHNSSKNNESSEGNQIEIAETDMATEPESDMATEPESDMASEPESDMATEPETDMVAEAVIGQSTIIPFTTTDQTSTDKEETTHVSETDEMSLVNDPDISSSISTEQGSFNAYTEDLVKQSRWRRLSDHVEMMMNNSSENDETFKDSPGKKMELDDEDETDSQATETSDDVGTQETVPTQQTVLSSVKSLSSNVLSDVTNMSVVNGEEYSDRQKKDVEHQTNGMKANAVAVVSDQQPQQRQENVEQLVDAVVDKINPTVAKIDSRRSSNRSIRFDHSKMLDDDSTNELDSDSDFELEQLQDTTVFKKPASVEEPFNPISYWDAKLGAIGVTTVSENTEQKAYEMIKGFLFSSNSPIFRFNPELEVGKKFAEF